MKSILPDQYAVEKLFNSRVDNFFVKYEISKRLRCCNFKNQRIYLSNKKSDFPPRVLAGLFKGQNQINDFPPQKPAFLENGP
jgi:hypothetical protein